MRVEPALTEEYTWCWVVYLGPERRSEMKRPCLFDRYACDRAGDSVPVDTKGLDRALQLLRVIQDVDWAGLSNAEQAARSASLHQFTRIPPPVRAWDDPHDTVVVTIREVVSGQSLILFVRRDPALDWGGIGGWQFFDARGPTEESLAIITKTELLALDPTMAEISNLPIGWQAHRPAPGESWFRKPGLINTATQSNASGDQHDNR